uniref:Ig-like domain-containing protein n=1 Tax=Cyprinus carpio TaxID=7962 RepID=A0A8C2H0C0_CYPCA
GGSRLFDVHVLLCIPHPPVVCVLSCNHVDSSYPYLFWYQQNNEGRSLELIGMLTYGEPSTEDKFKPRFVLSGHATKDAFLLISSISAEDSAVYFCAASLHSHSIHYKLCQITVHFAPV